MPVIKNENAPAGQINCNDLFNNEIRIMTFNIAKQHSNFSVLDYELLRKNQNVIFTVNESSYLQDLSKFGLVGWRHPEKLMSGLCLFVSSNLSAYSSFKVGSWGFYGTISPPTNNDGSEVMEVGFISTYRNPSLSEDQNESYFKEINLEAIELMKKTSLVYFTGDINVFNCRYSKTNWSETTYCYPNTPGFKHYTSMINSFPSLYDHMFVGVTHVPRNPAISTCSQLDYLIALHNGRCPKGRARVLAGTSSDHFGISFTVKIPKFSIVKPVFEERWRSCDTDFYLVEQTLRKLRLINPIEEQHLERDFVNHEIEKTFLIEATTKYHKRKMPKDAHHPLLVNIKILQSKAYKAHQDKKIDVYKKLEDEIRVVMTKFAAETMRDASEDRNSAQFYSWCRSIAKPTKATLGKFVMRNSDVRTIASEINTNYTNANAKMDWKEPLPVEWDDMEKIYEHFRNFDFIKAAKEVDKVPDNFKKLLYSEALLARQLTKCIIQKQHYPAVLKYSDCTLLPSRSIFSSAVPVNKIVEKFFNELLDVSKIDNYAYRPEMSCTSLLLAEFDTFAVEKTVYCVNADLKKAFDTMDRNAILGTISNTVLSNCMASWMDRKDAGYAICWRGERSYIDRVAWNRGVEPGSIVGPKLFIMGLQCSTKVYLKAIKNRKNIYADDSLPQYNNLLHFKEDTVDYLKHVNNLEMKVHLDGDKAISFIAVGQLDNNLIGDDITVNVDGAPIVIKRNFKVKQLGIMCEVSRNGKLSVDVSDVIDRVRSACFSLKHASKTAPASVLISTVQTFIVPVINYSICVWFPVIQADKKSSQIRQLRYWYTACMAICCFETTSLMGWSNSSKTLKEDTETELKLAHLTGLPVLNSIYQASCLSHYPQVLKLESLGWMEDTFKFFKRTQKCAYLKKEVADGAYKRVSPLRVLIDIVNSIRTHDLVSVTKALKIESELKMIETLFGKQYSPQKIRIFQRILSLHVMGKISDDYVKRRLDQESLDFTNDKHNQTNVSKRLKIVKRNVKDRPAIVQKIMRQF